MSIIALPLNLKHNQFAWGVVDNELEEVSNTTGNSKNRIVAPPRWTCNIVSNDDMTLSEAARWEALTLSLRGENVLALYDIVRYNPLGTMRGTPTVANTLAVGATSATLNGASGTLKQGDWLQLGTGFGTSQLVKVAADASAAAGSITFTFNNPIRKVISAGAQVTWDRPVAYFRRANRQATLGMYSTNSTGQGGFTLDLMERFG